MDTIRLLHVDDDPPLRDLASTALEREGDIAVTSAAGPADALDLLSGESFDCVVSDYDMPETDGLAFLRAVRREHGDLPFVLFTGKGSEEIASEAVSAGADDYIQKRGGVEQYELLANRARNLVEGRRAERERAESERQLSTLMDNVPGMAYRCRNEPSWPMEFVSAGCEELTGYEAESLVSGDVVWAEDVLHPEDAGEMWAPVQEALEAGEPFEVTYRIQTADGETKWVWERGRGVYEVETVAEESNDDGVHDVSEKATDVDSERGEVVALEGFISDVTERRRMERELRSLNEKVNDLHAEARLVHEAETPSDVWERAVEAAESVLEFEMCDLCEAVDGRFELRAASEAVSTDQIRDRRTDEGIAGQTYQEGEGIMVEDIAENGAANSKHEGVRSGISVPIGDVGVFQAVETVPDAFDEDDLELAGLLMDHVAAAVERLRSEAELRAERDRFATLFEQVPDPTVVADFSGDGPSVRSVNSAFEETFGYDEAELVGRSLNDVIVPEAHCEEAEQMDSRAMAGEQVEREVRRETRDGELRDFLFRSVNAGTDPPLGFGVYTEITDRKRYEAALERQNERLDAFARVVSHDLRTPLNVAAGHLELAAEECDSEHLAAAEEGLDRLEALIDDVLALSRRADDVEVEPVSLPAAARRVWDALDREGATLHVDEAFDADGRILADEDPLLRLLENLLRNAVEHGGDDVTVDVRPAPDAEGFVVADDGTGIQDGVGDRVFEEGVSLDDSGTGIGLAVVRQVVDAHDWDVRLAESETGGARFVVTGVERP